MEAAMSTCWRFWRAFWPTLARARWCTERTSLGTGSDWCSSCRALILSICIAARALSSVGSASPCPLVCVRVDTTGEHLVTEPIPRRRIATIPPVITL